MDTPKPDEFCSPRYPKHVFELRPSGADVGPIDPIFTDRLIITTDGATRYSTDQVEIDSAKLTPRTGITLGQAINAANVRWALDNKRTEQE